MVPNTSDDLPEPETPVNTVSQRFWISTLTSFRLLTRAPWTRMREWLSASAKRSLRSRLRPDESAGSFFMPARVRELLMAAMPLQWPAWRPDDGSCARSVCVGFCVRVRLARDRVGSGRRDSGLRRRPGPDRRLQPDAPQQLH